MNMAKSSALMELRLIKEKVSKRFQLADTISHSAWMAKKMDLPPGERFLVLSPHPDDDVIGCGGTLLKILGAGKALRILYLSLPKTDAGPREVRKREIEKSLRVLGATEYRINEADFPSTLKDAASMIKDEILGWRPDCVMAPSPLENHDQHLAAYSAFQQAMGELRERPDALLYEIWAPLVPNMVVDISDQLEQKMESIRAHESQVTTIDYCAMIAGLNRYRALSNGLKGHAEAFMSVEGDDVTAFLK
jgi:LmbE family N-acetylglucosaminyl deacetylase